ncbi:Gfo/Idh/MocA family oxidoreductase [Dyadobacter sp. CY356]|nr:Gfo/Idh/MocA family oxidoreductase [Dyadobacter sp. CY356]
MKNNKIGVGIIGANTTNWASKSHIPALKLIPEFDLAAVSTTRMSTAKAAADQFGARYAFDNESDLVNCPDVDLVVIAVKVPYHYKLVKAAIEAGKMIYCEWPLGNGTTEAQHLASLAADRGLRTFTGLQAISLPETVYLKRVIAEGLIGEVLSSSVIGSAGGWASSRTTDDLYLLDPANGASMIEIPFAHTLAAFVDVLSGYKTVNAVLARRRQEVPLLATGEKVPQLTYDQIVLSGTLENGSVASMHYRSGISAGTNFLWEINGTKGDIVITGNLGHYQLSTVQLQYSATGNKLTPLVIPDDYLSKSTIIPDQPVHGMYYAYQTVLNDIKNNTRHFPDFESGVRMHKFLDQIYESAASKLV